MERHQVKNGLECCQKSMDDFEPFQKCGDCPYNKISVCVQDCRSYLSRDALMVIEELEDQIRKLKIENQYIEGVMSLRKEGK